MGEKNGAIRWRGGDGYDAPSPVHCDPVGYPHKDADGLTQFENTHFATEAEAWDAIRRSAEASQFLDARYVNSAQRELDKASRALVHSALRRARVDEAYDEWCRAATSPLGRDHDTEEGAC